MDYFICLECYKQGKNKIVGADDQEQPLKTGYCKWHKGQAKLIPLEVALRTGQLDESLAVNPVVARTHSPTETC